MATFDGTTRKIFLDGTELGSDTPTGLAVTKTDNFCVGSSGNSDYFNGQMRSIKVWNTSRLESYAPSSAKHECEVDNAACMNMTLNTTSCTFASFNQLSHLMEKVHCGSQNCTDFDDYVTSKIQTYAPACSNDIVHDFRPRSNWRAIPVDSQGSYDSAGDYRLFVFGVPRFDEQVKQYGVMPADAGTALFVTTELDRTQTTDPDNEHKGYLWLTALQVALCSDGTVQGKLGMVPSSGSFCSGDLGYSRMDAIFRDAVAVARFQLVKARQETTSAHCSEATWDGRQCMNDLMSDSGAKCHLVKIDHICLVDALTTTTCEPTANHLAPYQLTPSGTTVSYSVTQRQALDQLVIFTDGGKAMNTNGVINDCAYDQPLASKCMFKVCSEDFQIGMWNDVGHATDLHRAGKRIKITTSGAITLNNQIITGLNTSPQSFPWD